jgi:predicted AAA+ superfamily ATPase
VRKILKRHIYQSVKDWSLKPDRKPLVLRGARQVGKTHVANKIGREFTHYVMANFEKQPALKDIFVKDLDPKRICRDLSILLDVKIIPGKTLLFLDEIQEAPLAITSLRYFYEEYPELHVMAAGSLLDFALEEVGIPVGRVEFLYVYPMSFIEFLIAMGREQAAAAILNHIFPKPMSDAIHERLLEYICEYLAIGGMPAVVKCWRDTQSLKKCDELKHDLIATYRQDFEKYSKKHQIKYVELLFDQAVYQLGKPFKFTHIPGDFRKRELFPCLLLLTKALVIKQIYHSDAQGLPLGAQASLEKFKALFIDVGLAQSLLGENPKEWLLYNKESLANKGELIESFVGQELLAYSNARVPAALFYWHRHERGSNAEIDYLIEYHGQIVPIEVKSGRTGTLKSMQLFLDSHHHSPYGIKISTQPYSVYNQLHSYPLYGIATLFPELKRILE